MGRPMAFEFTYWPNFKISWVQACSHISRSILGGPGFKITLTGRKINNIYRAQIIGENIIKNYCTNIHQVKCSSLENVNLLISASQSTFSLVTSLQGIHFCVHYDFVHNTQEGQVGIKWSFHLFLGKRF